MLEDHGAEWASRDGNHEQLAEEEEKDEEEAVTGPNPRGKHY